MGTDGQFPGVLAEPLQVHCSGTNDRLAVTTLALGVCPSSGKGAREPALLPEPRTQICALLFPVRESMFVSCFRRPLKVLVFVVVSLQSHQRWSTPPKKKKRHAPMPKGYPWKPFFQWTVCESQADRNLTMAELEDFGGKNKQKRYVDPFCSRCLLVCVLLHVWGVLDLCCCVLLCLYVMLLVWLIGWFACLG